MNFSKVVLTIIFFVNSLIRAEAQELYMPYNVRQAYEAGTRSYDGKPGANYFQNKSEYSINAVFDPESLILRGKEWITYYNNSPNALDKIVFRLYQDLFKKGNLRDNPVNMSDVYEGTTITNITVNDTVINLNDRYSQTREGTTMIVRPGFYILPGRSVRIFVQWEFRMPEKTTIRYGTYNKTSFMIAYWYPQIAVYDDIDGWDIIDYNGTQEFYNDFSDYEVEISVTSGNMVWATGNWENAADLLSPEQFERYNQAQASDEVIKIFSSREDYKSVKHKKNNVFKFRSSGTTDFAFAVSDNYLWDAVSTKINGIENRITMHAVYPKKSTDFKWVANIGKEAFKHYSEDVISVSYPFNHVVAFNGSGGMEFPMMINDGDRGDYGGALSVTSHELGHMYLPFMAGINEKKYAWMDEGLVTMLGRETEKKIMPDKQPDDYFITIMAAFGGEEQEIPPMIPSNQLRGVSYQIQAYYRPATAFSYLKEYLGEETFRKALAEFLEQWKGKHPIPYDLFYTFNRTCQKNLDWYWNAWFFNPGWVDVAVKDVIYEKEKCTLHLQNEGGLPVPLIIYFVFEDGHKEIAEVPADIWKNNRFSCSYSREMEVSPKEIYIDWKSIPDKNTDNNRFTLIK